MSDKSKKLVVFGAGVQDEVPMPYHNKKREEVIKGWEQNGYILNDEETEMAHPLKDDKSIGFTYTFKDNVALTVDGFNANKKQH